MRSSPWPASGRSAATRTGRSPRTSRAASPRRGACRGAVHGRILAAGRVAGSAKNRQPWRFVVLTDREAVERAAEAVWAGDNVLGAALVIGLIGRGKGPVSFDAGRAAQNMMLAAWNDGVGSCPNGIADAAAMGEALGPRAGGHLAGGVSFGSPARPVDPEARSPEEWIARADRRALDEVVERR